MSRPDIQYQTSLLSKFLDNPNIHCYEAALQLLAYLVKTSKVGITYGAKRNSAQHYFWDKWTGKYKNAPTPDNFKQNHYLHAFSDSSWSCPHPMAGYVIMLNGGAVSYASKNLKVVASSSCEAEYASASMCAKDITFVRNICKDLGFTVMGKVMLYVDNDAAISVCKNPGVSSANKHFEREIHYIRDKYESMSIDISFVPTDYQMADYLTKILLKTAFTRNRDYNSNC